ncbi:DUF1573 domain-containing protein [Clostridium tarantellae]|uniref:DUF1573 domain-containing protein n=1 Tax=Clostridium tarantellae TaxID=39493 RepID=A0A6I1MGR2_9CLOT|nr:DUF1573 domain-containing protein [Clostridium tarantellae]MPQ42360.1 DUF1573 domain-containing protein [Clostridium tarantellae]
MKDLIFDDFQNSVNNSLLRHKSILDILSKYQESQARANRAICKSVTNCGCIKINAEKQNLECEKTSLEDLNTCFKSHLTGSLCESCREVIERELGNNIFYITALCNCLDLNLYDILLKEYGKINTLGKFSFR